MFGSFLKLAMYAWNTIKCVVTKEVACVECQGETFRLHWWLLEKRSVIACQNTQANKTKVTILDFWLLLKFALRL